MLFGRHVRGGLVVQRLFSAFTEFFGFNRGGTRPLIKSKKKKTATPRSFHAVAIRPGDDSCEEIYRWTGRRILSADAPILPLRGCTAHTCTCQYKHFADRRAGPRRTTDHFNLPVEFSGSERRGGRGRRATDRLPMPR